MIPFIQAEFSNPGDYNNNIKLMLCLLYVIYSSNTSKFGTNCVSSVWAVITLRSKQIPMAILVNTQHVPDMLLRALQALLHLILTIVLHVHSCFSHPTEQQIEA